MGWPQSELTAMGKKKEKNPEHKVDPISAAPTNTEEREKRGSLLALPMGATSSPHPLGDWRAEIER